VHLHDRVSAAGGKVIANRCVERLSGLLNWAHERSAKDFGPNWRNPCTGVRKHQEFARKHVLGADQLRALMASLEDEPNVYVRAYVLLIVLTGARQGELRRLRWPDVNLEQAIARIGASKNGEDIYLRLSPTAVGVLRALPVISGSEFVFPGRPITQPMVEPRRAYKAALHRAELPAATTFHDLRRSFGTSLAMLGYSEIAIAAALNNTTAVAAKHYVNIAGSLVREATLKHEASLMPKLPAAPPSLPQP
jgi:integrase